MNTLKAVINEILGMFIDDGSLAFAILAIVGVASGVSIRFAGHPYIVGATLYIGCLTALVENVVRTTRKR